MMLIWSQCEVVTSQDHPWGVTRVSSDSPAAPCRSQAPRGHVQTLLRESASTQGQQQDCTWPHSGALHPHDFCEDEHPQSCVERKVPLVRSYFKSSSPLFSVQASSVATTWHLLFVNLAQLSRFRELSNVKSDRLHLDIWWVTTALVVAHVRVLGDTSCTAHATSWLWRLWVARVRGNR